MLLLPGPDRARRRPVRSGAELGSGGDRAGGDAALVIIPRDYQAEIEAFLEKDVGFVYVGQRVEVKVETFPFTKYGPLSGTVSFVSSDAVPDEKRGLIYQAQR